MKGQEKMIIITPTPPQGDGPQMNPASSDNNQMTNEGDSKKKKNK